VTNSVPIDPAPIRATAVLHQEGFLGIIALVGIFWRNDGTLAALVPVTSWIESIFAGFIVAFGVLGLMRVGLVLSSIRRLERWQGRLVSEWSPMDAIAVAVFSGLAEEALIRAFLQPWVGLVVAAVIFALLHIVPDRRLWAWPVIALVLGLVFGLVYERWGYPAVATAHIIVNLVSLLRLRRKHWQDGD
jgi:membrane protease YdiL (CAAX protease family)